MPTIETLLSIAVTSTRSNMSDLVANIVRIDDLQLYLKSYTFSNEKELERAITHCVKAIVGDLCLSNIDGKENPILKGFYKRYQSIYSSTQWEGYSERIAKSLWSGFFLRKKREGVLDNLRAEKIENTAYLTAKNAIQKIYSFSETDMLKLSIFVKQVLIGESYEDSYRRMLYLYSEQKRTGKTTFAKILCEVLNGYSEYTDATEFASTLAIEMQIEKYSVPKVAGYNCVMLDECFYQDMTKTYSNFKTMITNRGGSARLPYGQPFEWYGFRNYIATSNDNLKNFIADYSDRRFLLINFHEPIKTDNATLFELLRQYVANIDITDYKTEIDNNYQILEVEGEKADICIDYESEFLQNDFWKFINTFEVDEVRKHSAKNRITLSKIISYLNANKFANIQKKEVEKAMTKLFGAKFNDKYWLLPVIREKLDELRKIDGVETESLPF